MKKTFSFLAGLTLAGLLACGGGSKNDNKTPQAPAELQYTDPVGPSYKLVKNSTRSTGNKLVLELWGPTNTTQLTGRGVYFGLTADVSKVTFVKVDMYDDELVQNVAFDLGNEEPKLLKSVMDGNTLRVLVSQKGTGREQRLDQALARIALQIQPNVARDTTISLSIADNARVLPYVSDGSTPITIAVGTLAYR